MKKKKKKAPSSKVEKATEEIKDLEVNEKENEATEEKETEEAPTLDPFVGLKKKSTKKKPSTSAQKTEETTNNGEGETADAPDADTQETPASNDPQAPAWAGSNRDYTYEELANRIYHLMHTEIPSIGAGQKRTAIPPPSVGRDGAKKTVWSNFAEMCPALKRKPEHVLNYVLAELGTDGSVDGKHRLVIKGRFQPKQIETVIRHYISEYVACRTCKSPDTVLKKENRMHFVCCEACGSTRSVVPIKKGYAAQIGKRKKEQQ